MYWFRPSKITGSFKSVRICSKSGLRNWGHSVTSTRASTPESALNSTSVRASYGKHSTMRFRSYFFKENSSYLSVIIIYE